MSSSILVVLLIELNESRKTKKILQKLTYKQIPINLYTTKYLERILKTTITFYLIIKLNDEQNCENLIEE